MVYFPLEADNTLYLLLPICLTVPTLTRSFSLAFFETSGVCVGAVVPCGLLAGGTGAGVLCALSAVGTGACVLCVLSAVGVGVAYGSSVCSFGCIFHSKPVAVNSGTSYSVSS